METMIFLFSRRNISVLLFKNSVKAVKLLYLKPYFGFRQTHFTAFTAFLNNRTEIFLLEEKNLIYIMSKSFKNVQIISVLKSCIPRRL